MAYCEYCNAALSAIGRFAFLILSVLLSFSAICKRNEVTIQSVKGVTVESLLS